MYIGVLPYMQRNRLDLGAVPLTELKWLDNVVPPGATVADLSSKDYIVVFPTSKHMLKGFGKLCCQVNLLLAEPKAVHGKYYRLLWLLRYRYKHVLCRYPELVAKYSNLVSFNSAETWVDPADVEGDVGKPKLKFCSVIASAKTDLEGHQLRHQVVQALPHQDLSVDVLGRGYAPFEHKWQGLLPYQYSVIIENMIEPHYFTEKILDAFVCNTIPIYWGTADIGEYFDEVGIIRCVSLDDILSTIQSLPESPSDEQLLAAEKNRLVAAEYFDQPQRIALALKKAIEA